MNTPSTLRIAETAGEHQWSIVEDETGRDIGLVYNHPGVTRKDADELVKRWNQHDELVMRLNTAIEILQTLHSAARACDDIVDGDSDKLEAWEEELEDLAQAQQAAEAFLKTATDPIPS